MMAGLLIAALAAEPELPPDRNGGFSVAAIAERTIAGETSQRREALLRAQNLRAALIIDPVRTLEVIDPMEVRAIEQATGPLDERRSVQLAFFMRGAVVRLTSASDRYLVGYYDPLLDLWLVTPVARVIGEWRLMRAAFLDGAAQRGGGARWHEAAADPYLRLADASRASLASFEDSIESFAGSDSRGREMFEARTDNWLTSLAAWRQRAASLATAEGVRAEIAAGRLSATGLAPAELAREVDALPVEVRQSVAIIGAARQETSVSILMASPLMPHLLFVVTLGADDQPGEVTMVNFASHLNAGWSA